MFAPQTTAVIAPGFADDPQQQELYTSLFRVMLITPIIFAASLSIGDVLLAERRFLTYGLAPLLYNAGIIIGTVAFSDAVGIYGAAIGAVLGALLHLAIRLVGLRGTGFRPTFRLESTPAVGEFVRLMLPKMISHPVEPMTFLFFTSVASTHGGGERLVGQFRAQLPVGGGQHRGRGVRAGRLSSAVHRVRHRGPARLPARRCSAT